jgi:hypothetical protein
MMRPPAYSTYPAYLTYQAYGTLTLSNVACAAVVVV